MLSIICESFHNLHTFQIREMRGDEFPEAASFLSMLEKLESLCLDSAIYIDDETFVLLIKSCSKLKDLSLVYCNLLTDEGISQLPIFCRGLKRFSLLLALKITDKGFDHLSKLSLLESLTLNITKLTDTNVEKILLGCQNLFFLDLSTSKYVSFQTLITAYDLMEKGLVNKQLVIKYRTKEIEIKALESREKIHTKYAKRDYERSTSSEDLENSINGDDDSDSQYADLWCLFLTDE
ncbi:uncharacterized protein LOC141850798 [Brevipalpus obovatus]|uniref:uncharacterized protein LOC141850798 n=1 Tax=Brevipalpus obovatus TaxID=246614 RepID=UPI003D9F30A8